MEGAMAAVERVDAMDWALLVVLAGQGIPIILVVVAVAGSEGTVAGATVNKGAAVVRLEVAPLVAKESWSLLHRWHKVSISPMACSFHGAKRPQAGQGFTEHNNNLCLFYVSP
jgi:hypothetical protein